MERCRRKEKSQINATRKILKLGQNSNYQRCLRTLIYVAYNIHNDLSAEWYVRYRPCAFY